MVKNKSKDERSRRTEMEKMKTYSVVIVNGKKKIFINNKFSGEDKRKEAADVILGNKKVLI